MNIAVLSDIHGNYVALKRCVEYALNKNINTFLFLGDYTGELPYPHETLEFLYILQKEYTCYFIRGNRDDYLLQYRKNGEVGWSKGNSATGALLYTYENLTEKDFAFLESLPDKQVLSFPELPPLLICHGSPNFVNERMESGCVKTLEIIRNCNNSFILFGHTHLQGEIRYGEKVAWNPGSVGVSLASDGKTQCMILYGADHCWQKEFISLDYDVETVIEQLTESGLTDYAPYWCIGTKRVLRTGIESHGIVLARAMELCKIKNGCCNWPDIPDECWEQAISELIKS